MATIRGAVAGISASHCSRSLVDGCDIALKTEKNVASCELLFLAVRSQSMTDSSHAVDWDDSRLSGEWRPHKAIAPPATKLGRDERREVARASIKSSIPHERWGINTPCSPLGLGKGHKPERDRP
jgi:hypothetical protein